MRARLASLLPLAALLGVLPQGCVPLGSDVACTQMGCDDGASIAFSLTEPGAYSFELVADGTPVTCSATLPLPPCGQAPAATCSLPSVMLEASGCALSPAEHALVGISFMGEHPTAIEVAVVRDGTELGRQTFAPSYGRLAPNGEECGPICHHATMQLTL
jgi:hypothetical protein